jgi:hypothetical protein
MRIEDDGFVSGEHQPQPQAQPQAPFCCLICGEAILDLYYLTVGPQKHAAHLNCLRCEMCSNALEMHGKCYLAKSNGKFYCHEHFSNTFAANEANALTTLTSPVVEVDTCQRCRLAIQPNDYVIKIGCGGGGHDMDKRLLVYHLNCFKCTYCSRLIESGAKYGILRNEFVYCSEHYLQALDYTTSLLVADHHHQRSTGLFFSSTFYLSLFLSDYKEIK